MSSENGICWLCHKQRPLTHEHIPPRQAFNKYPLLLKKVDDQEPRSGELRWMASRMPKGQTVLSLCAKCNNTYGRVHGGSYVDFIKQVAERVGDVPEFHRTTICGVQWPLRILKQIMLQFVSANGPGFAPANPWVEKFVRDRRERAIPSKVCIYLYATNFPGGRRTGVTAHIDLGAKRNNTIAEFTFWPLGTVISFDGELCDESLTPVHHWKEFAFDARGPVELDLCINPLATGHPLDFRSASQVEADRFKTSPHYEKPS